jgi:hypothetical protein
MRLIFLTDVSATPLVVRGNRPALAIDCRRTSAISLSESSSWPGTNNMTGMVAYGRRENKRRTCCPSANESGRTIRTSASVRLNVAQIACLRLKQIATTEIIDRHHDVLQIVPPNDRRSANRRWPRQIGRAGIYTAS